MEIIDLFFPKRCLGCGELGKYLCPDCLNKLSVVSVQKCPMCEKKTISGKTHYRCKTSHGVDGLVAGMEHKNLMRKIISKYKFSYAPKT